MSEQVKERQSLIATTTVQKWDAKARKKLPQQVSVVAGATTDEQVRNVRTLLVSNRERLMNALPKHIDADQLINLVCTSFRKNPSLLKCSVPSLFAAINEASTYGWRLDGVFGHAYLVPFAEEVQLIPGYRGLLDLCRRSGQVSTVQLETVHEGDRFSYQLGDDPKIEHVPSEDPARETKPYTHVYCVVKLRDGGVQRSVWTRAKVEAHRDQYSQGWKKGLEYLEKCQKEGWDINQNKLSAWHTAPGTMAKKTVLRDMIQRGLIPMSVEHAGVAVRAEPDAVVSSEPAGAIEWEIPGEDREREFIEHTEELRSAIDGEHPDSEHVQAFRRDVAALDKVLDVQRVTKQFLEVAVEEDAWKIEAISGEAIEAIKANRGPRSKAE